MDSLDVIKVCLRRWYVFLPLVLLAAGAGLGLSKQVKSTYTATGSYAFLYPHPESISPGSDPRNLNPLVTQGYTALLGEAVQAQLSSQAMQDSLGASNRGWAPDEPATNNHYTVTLPPQSASYVVQTWADTEKAAADVVQAVLKAAPQSALDAQSRASAPEASRYTAFVTAPTQTQELPPQSPVKLLLTMIAIGAVAGAALSLLLDRLVPRRTKRRSAVRRPVRRRLPAGAPRPRVGLADARNKETAKPEDAGEPSDAGELSKPQLDSPTDSAVEPSTAHRESVPS